MRLFFTCLHSLLLSIGSLLLISSVLTVSAQVRTSPSYQLQSDSVNVGGGLSDSSSYSLESTGGEVATGPSDSATYSLRAGYQQMQSVFLSLSAGTDVVMTPDLPGITGGEANGSSTFTVITDSPAGYSLTIESENSPAMQRGDGLTIANYTPIGAADFNFAVSAGEAEFGFSPEGVDITQVFRDDGGTCGLGGFDTALSCWADMQTTAIEVARGSGANHPLGATTSLHYRVGVMLGAVVAEGEYTATSTVTALPL